MFSSNAVIDGFLWGLAIVGGGILFGYLCRLGSDALDRYLRTRRRG